MDSPSPQMGEISPGPLSIALVGTRGIPAQYGGFETFAWELSRRLAARGHDIRVYGRTKKFPWREEQPISGVRRISAWTFFGKHLETPLASLCSFFHLLLHPAQVIILCNAANSIFIPLSFLSGTPVMVNVDGVERKRAKWGTLGKLWYRIGELASLLFGSRVIADAYCIADYYADEYGVAPTRIAYGASAEQSQDDEVLKSYGLTPKEYVLYVSRMEPENNALGVVKAYKASGVTLPLVIVGDAPYAAEYKRSVQEAAAGSHVIFTGYQFGDSYRSLQSNCALYIQATEVGGTHPALIESMAFGNAIVANGVPEHFEVLGGAGLYYPRNDFQRLGEILAHLLAHPERLDTMRKSAQTRAVELFNWESIADSYETQCRNLLKS